MPYHEECEERRMVLAKDLSQLTAHEYGKLLRRVREHIDKTQQEMADQLDAPFTTYRKWEQGKRKPRSYYRRKIRATFEETLYELGLLKREGDAARLILKEDPTSPPTTAGKAVSPSTAFIATQSPPSSIPSEPQENRAIVVPSSEVLDDADPSHVSRLTLEDLGITVAEDKGLSEDGTPIQSRSLAEEPFPRIQTLLAHDLTMRLQAVAELPFRGYHPVHQAFARALKEFDTMPIITLDHYMNRREALCRMIGFPFTTVAFATVEQGGKFPPEYAIEGLLSRCATGIAACWEMYCNCDASNMSLAFECVSRYIPALRTIAQQSSHHREFALDLATRSAILKTTLALECLSPIATIPHALEAVDLSQETADISLQLSALGRLAWTYFNTKQPSLFPLALAPAEKGAALLEWVKSKIFLPPSVRGSTYSIQSIIQAINGLSPDPAQGMATELDPSMLPMLHDCDTYAFMQFTSGTQVSDAGLAQYHSGNPQAALVWFARRVDPDTLEAKIIQGSRTSERGRIYTINAMIPAALKTRDRDKEQIIAWWQAAIEGAKTLRSEQLFNDALIAYDAMEYAWPGDKDILDLRDQKKHWEVKEKHED
jgi:transcriptional regulator with XRE-family HTH domain